jgi:uncharacterized protein (DUF983 family)
MPNRSLDDWEYPEPDDDEDEDVAETVPCPECGKPVYEEAEQCPYCGEYITHSTSPLAGRSPLYIAVIVLGIIALIATLLIWPV